jgi:hypothetical protein
MWRVQDLPQLLAGLCASAALGLLAVVAVEAPEAGTRAASPAAGAASAQHCNPGGLGQRTAVVERVPRAEKSRYRKTRIVQACD